MTGQLGNLPPRERGGWGRWLWLMAACAVMALLIAPAAQWLVEAKAPGQRRFDGTLSPGTHQIDLRLPAGIPLTAVLTSAGQEVSAGETIALLDLPKITARADMLRRHIRVNAALRACLMDAGHADVLLQQIREELSAPTAETASPLPESGARHAIGPDLPLNQQELSLQLQRTAETCKNTHNEAALHQRKLLNALEDLRAKSRRLALRAATPPTGDEDVRSQRLRLISLALDREQTSKSIAQMELQLSALATEQTRANLRRVQQLEQDAQRQIGELEILMSYAATPRLYAPQSGTILRTRPLPESGTFQQDVVFATLQLGASDLHRAVFTASEDALPYLKPGDPITITLSGIGLHSQLLDGEIRTLRPYADTGDGTPAQHLVDVSLSAESAAFLASKSAETAYAGATSSAHITVTLPERPLVQALWRSLEQVSQTAGIW